MILYKLFCLLLTFLYAQAQAWDNPGFIEYADAKNEVDFEDNANPDIQIIHMNENYAETIALLNYKGNDPPQITKFTEPSANSGAALGAEFERFEDNSWKLVITIAQNYDNKDNPKFRYVFNIAAGGKTRQVFLYVRNIDDSPPLIKPGQNPCVIQENMEPGASTCTYTITDADGVMKDTVNYRLLGEKGINEIFLIENEDQLENGVKTWNVSLHTRIKLNFEETSLYIFDFEVEDSGANKDSIKIVVEVGDQPDEPPRWKNIFASKTLNEKTTQTYPVEAVDGDVKLNYEINYELITKPEWTEYFSIDAKTGVITVNEIDRDALQNEIFTFTLVAFEVPDPTAHSIPQQVTIIVEDVNDNIPKITLNKDEIWISESRVTTLDIEIEIYDLDLGDNAIFDVSLGDDKFNKAFEIVPNRAYQKWTFFISVADSASLDYEDPDWRTITLQVKSVEAYKSDHTDLKTITVHLENWNDEEPKFEEDNYEIPISEDIGDNEFVAKVFATDRDVGDSVKHSLVGEAINQKFKINETTGEIRTKIKDALDYEKERILFIQVKAEDTLGDKERYATYAQLTINVIDVNDEQPKISVPTEEISIFENLSDGAPVNGDIKIIATDEDTSADLKFSIDWVKSYALKNGRRVDEELYKGCIKLEEGTTIKSKTAEANLVINEIEIDNTPNYEFYDTLYITLMVEDLAQEIGPATHSQIIVIDIKDENDNDPIFTEESITSKKSVIEKVELDKLIATVIAKDEDGPDFNQITYSITPEGGTPEDWVKIDIKTGDLRVAGTIDADLPIEYLKYIVNASDGERFTEKEISIEVIDTNDNRPLVTWEDEVPIPEGSCKSEDEVLVQIINVQDDDRDEPYHTPWFRFSQGMTEEVRNFFSVNDITGKVYVDCKDTERELDRDKGTSQFQLTVIVGDNFDRVGGVQFSDEYSFSVVLQDVNDNAPKLITENLDSQENANKDALVGSIEAYDEDEINTDNSKIVFSGLIIKKGDNNDEDPPQDLFYLESNPNQLNGRVNLLIGRDLRGYYGTYHVTIQMHDLGTPKLTSEGIVKVDIREFNFEKPEFIFPNDGEAIYLTKFQEINRPLDTYIPGGSLQTFSATDMQNEKWNIVFSIEPEHNIFKLEPAGKSKAQLQLKSQPNYDDTFKLQIVADCNCVGNDPRRTSVTIDIRFIDENTQPYFDHSEETHQFHENVSGVNTVAQLGKASYNGQGEEWDLFNIYYFISDNPYFEIDKKTAQIKLIEMLDHEEEPQHTLVVVASQSSTGNLSPDEKSKLTVHIEVMDVNDNPPNFDGEQYYGSVKQSDELHKVIRQVIATDLDKNDTMTFTLDVQSLKAVGEGIKDIQTPFYMKPESGNIYLNFQVLHNMKGYFTFTIIVADKDNQQDTASVTMYVVSESSKFSFRFKNDLQTVQSKETEIKEIMEKQFRRILDIENVECNIETIQEATGENGETLDGVTNVFIHFIDPNSNEPIASDVIEEKVNIYQNYVSLETELRSIGLYLENDAPPADDIEGSLLVWLISVSAVLGVLSVALIIAFIIKTRSLTRRLNKLSTTSFGSQESGLNRAGITVPNTNKHAIEGSNPVYNEEKKMPEIDTISIGSGDSDLIGVEDNPNFQHSYDDNWKIDLVSKDKY